MSKLLNEIIKERRAQAQDYKTYLKKIAELAKKVQSGNAGQYSPNLKTAAQRHLYNNLGKDEDLALRVDAAVRAVKKSDWRGNPAKENEIKAELYKIFNDRQEVERVFSIVRQQDEY
jgi:type I restriction enzyme R subunit